MYNDSGGKMKDVAPILKNRSLQKRKSMTELPQNSKAKQLTFFSLQKGSMPVSYFTQEEMMVGPEENLRKYSNMLWITNTTF